MLKQFVFVLALALSVASAVHVTEGPLPGCYPCDSSGN